MYDFIALVTVLGSFYFLYCLRLTGLVGLSYGINMSVILFSGVIGWFSYGLMEWHKSPNASFYDLGLSHDQIVVGLFYTVWCEFLISFGYIVFVAIMIFHGKAVDFRRQNTIKVIADSIDNFSYLPGIVIICGSVMVAYSVGFAAIFSRIDYLPVDNQPLFTAGQFMMIAGCLAIGYASPKTKPSFFYYILKLLFLFIVAATFFSLASRVLALIPLLYIIGRYSSPLNRRGLWYFLFYFLLTIIVLPVPLFLRSLPAHGLYEYLFVTNLSDVFVIFLDGGETIKGLMLNIGFSIPLTVATITDSSISLSDLIISINPMPGDYAGWYNIYYKLRINEYIPYNLIGELFSLGVLGWIVLVAIGFIIAAIDYRASYLSSTKYSLIAVAMYGFIFVYTILSSQYNLRSSSRMLYYAASLVIFSVVLIRLSAKPDARSYRSAG